MVDYYVSDLAQVEQGCFFGNNVVVEDDVILGEGVSVGHGAVILKGVRLGAESTVGAGSILGKPPLSPPSSERKAGEGGLLLMGPGVVIGCGAVLHAGSTYEEECYIGDLAAIREGCRFESRVLIGRQVAVEEEVIVGRESRIQTGCYITGLTVIGKRAFLGPRVITTNDRYMSMWNEKRYEGPRIGNGCAIGAGACLLAGVRVGDRAVIGMGAVVLEDVPSGRVFAGVPARDIGAVRSQ